MSSAHRYLAVLDKVAEAHAKAKSAKAAKSAPKTKPEAAQNAQNAHAQKLDAVLVALESRCPDLVPPARWQQAIEVGRAFLAKWGRQAEALGWTARDLFGLHQPPTKPHPSYSRLSRYDHTGLVWLLQGRPVVALTENMAAIQSPSGNVTVYRKLNKPALGPVGDSLDDYHAPPSATDARPFHSPPARCHPGDLSGSAESEQ
jgi:hypothetical protein